MGADEIVHHGASELPVAAVVLAGRDPFLAAPAQHPGRRHTQEIGHAPGSKGGVHNVMVPGTEGDSLALGMLSLRDR